jgi:hypothetical protein
MADPTVPTDHAEFLSLLPGLATHARFRFRYLTAVNREEAVADAVAYGFVSFLRLKQRGKQPTAFPAAFATFVVLATAKGRAVGRSCTSRDVLTAGGCRGFKVHGLDIPDPDGHEWWRDAVADQACFNLDFAEWEASFPEAKKRIAGLLAFGHSEARCPRPTDFVAGPRLRLKCRGRHGRRAPRLAAARVGSTNQGHCDVRQIRANVGPGKCVAENDVATFPRELLPLHNDDLLVPAPNIARNLDQV